MNGKINYLTPEEIGKLKDEILLENPISIQGYDYYLKEYLGKGMKSVVWRGISRFNGTDVAVKFSTIRDYEENDFTLEVKMAGKLHKYNQFAKYYGAEKQVINTVECIVFIEEYVEGFPLKEFTNITPSFIESYINQFSQVLSVLKEKKLRHDDLNLGNIMIVPPLPGVFVKEYTLKVIDMGSLKDYDSPLKESKMGFDDRKRFCVHLKYLSNQLIFHSDRRRKPISKKEKLYRSVIKKLLPSLLEDDQNIAITDPEKIAETFVSEFAKCNKPIGANSDSIETPFDYISADHIGSDVLLNQLFATSCPWLEEVKNNTPILLTGPRGCGKSMIFRWLSFKSMLAKGDIKAINNTSIVGFYISCSSDLKNRFSLYDTQSKTERAKEEIIHYFNLLLSREIVLTLSQMSSINDNEFGFTSVIENVIYDHFIESLGLNKSRLYLQGSKPFDHLYDIIIREMNTCYQFMLQRKKVPNATPLTYLSDLTKLLKGKVSFFSNKTLTFLLDDYSLHRISEPVQIILNNILWERQSNHIFKVSSEKFGMVQLQDNSSSYSSTSDMSREYREIDVGEKYITLSDKEELNKLIAFCTDLLDHRLKLAHYHGTTAELIGKSNYGTYGTLEKALRNQNKSEKKDYDEYHGIETISKVCSGDISALLEMYRRMFKEGEITSLSKSIIPKTKQHKAIQSTSRVFFEIIKTFNFGQDLYDIVNNFGNLSRRILQEGRPQKDGPNVTTRIEVDELEDVEKWKPDLKNLFFELIHRSIFISLEPGRGRRTMGTTLRIQLRRIYIPQFKTGLIKNTALKLTNSEFKHFLTDPKTFCDNEFEMKWSISKKGNNNVQEIPFKS